MIEARTYLLLDEFPEGDDIVVIITDIDSECTTWLVTKNQTVDGECHKPTLKHNIQSPTTAVLGSVLPS